MWTRDGNSAAYAEVRCFVGAPRRAARQLKSAVVTASAQAASNNFLQLLLVKFFLCTTMVSHDIITTGII